ELDELGRRMCFSTSELDALGLDRARLAPFFFDLELARYVSDRPPGDTPLEFHPLLDLGGGILVVHPGVLSLAVRALILQAVKAQGLEEEFQEALQIAQETYAASTTFWPAGEIRLSAPDENLLRASVCEVAPGRYLHVIQVPTSLETFP